MAELICCCFCYLFNECDKECKKFYYLECNNIINLPSKKISKKHPTKQNHFLTNILDLFKNNKNDKIFINLMKYAIDTYSYIISLKPTKNNKYLVYNTYNKYDEYYYKKS